MNRPRLDLTPPENRDAQGNWGGWMLDMRRAIAESVSADDCREIVQGVVKRAKEGDPAAIKTFFEQIAGGKTPLSITHNTLVVQGGEASPEELQRIMSLLEHRGPTKPGLIAAELGISPARVQKIVGDEHRFERHGEGVRLRQNGRL